MPRGGMSKNINIQNIRVGNPQINKSSLPPRKDKGPAPMPGNENDY